MRKEDEKLLEYLRQTIDVKDDVRREINDEKIIKKAKDHGVLPVLYELFCDKEVEAAARVNVYQHYKLLHTGTWILKELAACGIRAVPFKGIYTARWYKTKELRKSGDIDILLADPSKLEDAINVLTGLGLMKVADQHSNYHVSFLTEDGIEVELHSRMIEALSDARVNDLIDRLQIEACENTIDVEFNGETIGIFSEEYEALVLLLHMLHHFLRSGFGLKLLYDWSVFWNCNFTKFDVSGPYYRFVKALGLSGFADLISAMCKRYLGLREYRHISDWQDLGDHEKVEDFYIEEILENLEFGARSPENMVKLQGAGPLAYIKEFHHQMHINFPVAGKVFIIWPVLWIWTLARFIRNNRKIRNVRFFDVIKSARKNSRYMSKIRLFIN